MGFWSKAAQKGITAAGLTNPVPVTMGGTGATSAANARTALGGSVVGQQVFTAADAAAARAALGVVVDHVALTLPVASLIGTGVYRVVSPVAGTIKKLWSVIDGALATGDATLTGKIGATAITGGAMTIAQAGSAAGDVDSATPTAANTVAAGDMISVTVGGTNSAARGALVTILIDPSA